MFYNNCQGIYSIIYLLIEIRYYNQYGYYCAHLTVYQIQWKALVRVCLSVCGGGRMNDRAVVVIAHLKSLHMVM